MSFELKNIGENAAKLSRNPLGIIALFIVLVYGIAALVLGSSGDILEASQKWPIVIFLVFFPILVLAVFSWLVIKHHTKLYAPGDYSNEEGFFRALTPEEQRVRLDKEVNAIAEEQEIEQKQKITEGQKESSTKEISPLNLRTAVVLIEELVFRELEAEFGSPIMRQVGTAVGEFDGLFRLKNSEVAVEVKYTKKKNWKDFANQALALSNALSREKRFTQLYLLVVIVSEGLTQIEINKASKEFGNLVQGAPVFIKLRTHDFEKLKEKYGYFDIT